MTRLSRVMRCLRLAENHEGRDFVVGDLHGHRALLETALDAAAFDPSCDRVLSVGDLIDRGPQSLATLALIEEPWFHAVLGNHELMLLHQLGFYTSRRLARKAASGAGREWIDHALRDARKTVLRLAEQVARLPLAIHVEGALPFNVMHGDLVPLGAGMQALFDAPTMGVHQADNAATSRRHIATLQPGALLALRFDRHAVQFGPVPLGAQPLTYVGHSPMPLVTVHASYVYIDQGVRARRRGRQAAPVLPTLLEHGRFASWISGVARARQSDAPRPPLARMGTV